MRLHPLLLLTLFVTSACQVTHGVPEDPALATASAYRHEERAVRGLRVDDVTDAPLQIVAMARVDLPPEELFALTVTGLDEWVRQVAQVTFDHGESRIPGALGQGSLRRSTFEGQELVERIRWWDPPHGYAFSILNEESGVSLPIVNHLGVFLIEPSEGGSLVTWRQYYGKSVGLRSLFLDGYLENRMMWEALERLVERHGGTLVTPDLR